MLDEPGIQAKRLEGQLWYEIDDVQDLDIAESMFAPDNKKRMALLQQRYGGYWRYPHLLDFCYLVNPYFPPRKLMDEIKANFEKLLTQYPSGMRVNALLAAKNFGVRQEQILVGNGAAELIKALMEGFEGKTGLIRPTFEEYGHRIPEEKLVVFEPAGEGFSYTAEDIMSFFGGKDIANLILINPDNPSGNYISKGKLLELLQWAREHRIKLVVDESFCDFADERNNTLIESTLLEENPNLFVMKSISKSYGVPGLRLGVLASGDTDAIARMKKEVAIWNINSFGEFYMQICGKYEKEYAVALETFRQERVRFEKGLKEIPGLKLYPSQANYLMARLENGMGAGELTERLVNRHSILIKDLSGKTGGAYVRLAIRNREDNDRLLGALREEMKG